MSAQVRGVILLISLLANCALAMFLVLRPGPDYVINADGSVEFVGIQKWEVFVPWIISNNTGVAIATTINENLRVEVVCPNIQKTISALKPDKGTPEFIVRAHTMEPLNPDLYKSDKFNPSEYPDCVIADGSRVFYEYKENSALISCKSYSWKELGSKPSVTIEAKNECP